MMWAHYAPHKHALNLHNNILTVWLQLKLFSICCQKCLWQIPNSFSCRLLFFGGDPVTLLKLEDTGLRSVGGPFLQGSHSPCREGSKVQSKHVSECHQILESHLKEGRLPLWKENGSFWASFLLFLKKKKRKEKKATMLQYFSRQNNTVPDGGGNTAEQKGRYLGFRGNVGEVGGCGGLNQADLGGGGVIISAEDIAPPWGGPSADLAPRSSGAQPQPLPALADPTTWSDRGAFKTFACCTRAALCVQLDFLRKKTKSEEVKKKSARGRGGGRGSAGDKRAALSQLQPADAKGFFLAEAAKLVPS